MTGATGLLNRLAGRIETVEPDKTMKIARYGMWGTTAEIERRGPKKWTVVQLRKKDVEFKRLVDAEEYLLDLVRHR
ncbi:MAG: hypothetical protein II008_06510 [Oscillospiraceae bacterium]|nr:hypothetical protein [Oscillospiraceae bacterium]